MKHPSVTECCSVLQCVAVHSSVVQCIAVCSSAQQCVHLFSPDKTSPVVLTCNYHIRVCFPSSSLFSPFPLFLILSPPFPPLFFHPRQVETRLLMRHRKDWVTGGGGGRGGRCCWKGRGGLLFLALNSAMKLCGSSSVERRDHTTRCSGVHTNIFFI